MKVVSRPHFNFGDWVSSHDLFWQSQFIGYLKASPLLIITYGFILSRYTLKMSNETAILTPMLAGVMVFFLTYQWEYKNKDYAVTRTPINITIRYNKTQIPQEINIIKSHLVIKEDYSNNKFSYAVSLERPITDIINNEEFQYFILNSSYNWDITMQKVDKCWVAYNGSVFEAPAAMITVDWATDFKNVVKVDDEYDVVAHRVFNLAWCPEMGDKYQEAIGVISKQGEITIIQESIKTYDANNSVKTLMQLRDEKSLNANLVTKIKDSGEQMVQHVGTLIDNDRFIRKPNMIINWRSTKVRLLLILGAIALGAAAYWYIYVRPVTK
jgi:hypothetical protein